LTVKVSAGTAFDSQGRQIILLYEKAVDLVEANNKNPISDGEYTLSIRYSEELTDKQGDDEFTTTRVQEKPEFVLSLSSAKPDDTISLAKLTIKDKKVTIDQNVREYSGINLPTEDGKGVTLRAQVGVLNQAILEGSLSISGGLTVLGETHIKGSLKVQGDLHIVQSLQIGDAPESQSVNRIVNEIREGTKDKADEKALITVKAAVDLAETKANKNGNSKEDFTAAHLRVNTLTINQKDVTAICDEINEEEEKENETAIPTIAAIRKYMESLMPPPVVTGVQMTYTREKSEGEKIEVTWNGLKRKTIEVNIPILLRERILIIPKGREMSDLTLMCIDEGWKGKIKIKKMEGCWECTVKGVEEEKEEEGRVNKETVTTLVDALKKMKGWKQETIRMWEEEAGKLYEARQVVSARYNGEEGWKCVRERTVIEELKEMYQKEVWDVMRNGFEVQNVDRFGYTTERDRIVVMQNLIQRGGDGKIFSRDHHMFEEEAERVLRKKREREEKEADIVIPPVWKAKIVEKKGS
jgi:hypothetical protein